MGGREALGIDTALGYLHVLESPLQQVFSQRVGGCQGAAGLIVQVAQIAKDQRL